MPELLGTTEAVLDVRNLQVSFSTRHGTVRAVDGVELILRRGEILAVVGKSGCGKTVTALDLLGLSRGANTRIWARSATADATW